MGSAQPTEPIRFGASWYPEHWPRGRWPEDLRLMREASCNVVRMGEFAWSALEPEPRRFDLDWLADAVALAADAGMATVLGTPTAAPPAWLVDRFPDLLAVDEDGRRTTFGRRCHYCVTSPDFHEAARRIAAAMASRFGDDPNVIGWQLDNEYNRVCYCDRCRAAFQRFLAERYGTLDRLNEAWSTRYWSQTYTRWEQIPLPRVIARPGVAGPHNPGARLEFRRFVTDAYRRFQASVAEEVRRHVSPTVWLTHNFMGWYGGYDHYALAADLDLVGWDWYVATGHHDPYTSGLAHDLVRGFKRRPFWVLETQVGHANYEPVSNALDHGEARAMAWHAVAYGADGLLYWQWRMALGGQEQYWGTVVDQAGLPRPVYDEIRQIGAELAAASPAVAGSTPLAEVAILNDYDSRWAIEIHRHHRDFDYVAHLAHYHRPLAERNLSVDVVSADAALDGYRLVVAPALHVLTPERVARLRAFVEGGGHLVLTVRTGMKDTHNALLPSRQPGALAALAGAEVEDYYALEGPVPVVGPGLAGETTVWAERLRVIDAAGTEVLARFGRANGWLDGHPAITARGHGAGRVYLVGAYLDAAAQRSLMAGVVAASGVAPTMATPPGVVARCRSGGACGDVLFLVNHAREERTVPILWPGHEWLSGRWLTDEVRLPPLGVAVLTSAPPPGDGRSG